MELRARAAGSSQLGTDGMGSRSDHQKIILLRSHWSDSQLKRNYTQDFLWFSVSAPPGLEERTCATNVSLRSISYT